MTYRFLAGLYLASFSFGGQVNAAEPTPPVTTVNVGGFDYSVTYSTQPFSSIESSLTSQPWWGNAVLAREFVNSIGNNISFYTLPEGGINPYFVVSSTDNRIRFIFSAWSTDGQLVKLNVVDTIDDSPQGVPTSLCGVDGFPCAFAIATRFFSGPSILDTLNSFRPNAFALRNALNMQSAKIAQGLSYDCTAYDQKNICVSFVGTKSDGKGFDATTGALILAHKPISNFRYGGYIDQSIGSTASGGLNVKNGNPGYGAFAVWSQNSDGSGVQIRAAANIGKVDIETTRIPGQVSTAEAGFGKSNIKSNGFQLEVSKNYAINNMWSARPYVGYRKTTNTRAGYTETNAVDFPLTYSSLKQNTETLIAGTTFAHSLSANTTIFMTAGVEHDLKNRIGNYAATSIDIEIDSIDMSADKRKTRPIVSFALSHDIDKTQRVGVSLTHRKEAFASGSTTWAFLQYSTGF